MIEAVVDTNFLMLAHQFKLNIPEQLEGLLGSYRMVTCSGVMGELEKLSLGKGRNGAAARYALKLVKECNVEVKKSIGDVDEWIVSYCKRRDAVACTVDKKLRERLKREGVRVVIMRGKKTLEFA
ncbi:MAG: nucleotide-binding protein [Candidatus Micrarchaeia archaeon]